MAGATTADLIGTVRRRQGLVSRRDVGGRHRFGADATCASCVAIRGRSRSVPGAAESARLFGCYARPGSRPPRAFVATGPRTALLVMVTARRACAFLCSVIRVPPRQRVYRSTKPRSFAFDRRVCTPNIVGTRTHGRVGVGGGPGGWLQAAAVLLGLWSYRAADRSRSRRAQAGEEDGEEQEQDQQREEHAQEHTSARKQRQRRWDQAGR